MIRKMEKSFFVIVFFLFCIVVLHFSVAADEEESFYYDECGSCHFAYQPELLPEASWTRIFSGLDNHFGETVILDDDLKRVILIYINSRSAENSSEKHAIKIMGSLGNDAPLRITDIPYIRKEHKDISPDTFNRESIRSFSNCAACHLSAEDGVYSKDDVSIPE